MKVQAGLFDKKKGTNRRGKGREGKGQWWVEYDQSKLDTHMGML
jgi:hypothetical protein